MWLSRVTLTRDPLMPADPPALALFLVELKAADWPGTLRWYEDALGLSVVLRDEEHGFALLASGGTRIGLKRSAERADAGCRLIFQVDDLEAARVRLDERGVGTSPPSENTREGYREIRLTDPEGTPVTLFQWLRPPGRF
jgi:hypothetical protein